mgnify:FL=1
MILDTEYIKQHILTALKEDVREGDHSSLACIDRLATSKAKLVAKQDCIICGVDIARMVFELVDDKLQFQAFASDGQKIKKGDIVFKVEGSAISILTAERTLLNYMQRLSGIATTTSEYVSLIAGTSARLLDTRKTTPTMRILEKYAVKTGGGTNHRIGLFDMIMLKDNHIDFAGGIEKAIDRTLQYLKDKQLDLKIEIEVRNFEELQRVLAKGGVNRIMLDNFSVEDTQKAVKMIDHKYEIESSGGITAENILSYAQTGVDFISVGALTHQIKSIDLSLLADD